MIITVLNVKRENSLTMSVTVRMIITQQSEQLTPAMICVRRFHFGNLIHCFIFSHAVPKNLQVRQERHLEQQLFFYC